MKFEYDYIKIIKIDSGKSVNSKQTFLRLSDIPDSEWVKYFNVSVELRKFDSLSPPTISDNYIIVDLHPKLFNQQYLDVLKEAICEANEKLCLKKERESLRIAKEIKKITTSEEKSISELKDIESKNSELDFS